MRYIVFLVILLVPVSAQARYRNRDISPRAKPLMQSMPQPQELQSAKRKKLSKNRIDFWSECTISESQKSALKRPTSENKKTSLIIPCYHKHAPRLYSLLRMYENQSKLPDEVVISLSESHLVEEGVLAQLQSELWAFPVILVMCDEKKFAGENRNTACEYATGDIFICQDADDIPHSQRIEIIHYFFSTYAIDHLMHEFRMVYPGEKGDLFQMYDDLTCIQIGYTRDFELTWEASRFTNGNVSITRHLFDQIKWTDMPRGQDSQFNRMVYQFTDNCITIGAVLYGYRQYLSSLPANKKNKHNQVEVMSEVVYTNEHTKQHAIQVIKEVAQ